MRQISSREKTFLGLGALIILFIFVYFILWPMLQGGQSGAEDSLEELQAKLKAMEKLEEMNPVMIDLETRMKSQSGYNEMSFKRGIADSIMIKYIAEIAAQSEIREIEQLDARLDTRRKKSIEAAGNQGVLGTIVDQIYLAQIAKESETEDNAEKDISENSETPPKNEENEDKEIEQENSDMEKDGKSDESEIADTNTIESKPDESAIADTAAVESEPDESTIKSEKPTFPPIPLNIPTEVRKSLVKWLQDSRGRTFKIADIAGIINQVAITSEESESAKKALQIYRTRVEESKTEIRQWLGKLDVLQASKSGKKTDIFSIKMVFKSQMEQLVKLLYNLQDKAKWLKVESLGLSVADRKQTTLAVEISMTATAVYGL